MSTTTRLPDRAPGSRSPPAPPRSFDTALLSWGQWLTTVAMASTVLWAGELRKLVIRYRDDQHTKRPPIERLGGTFRWPYHSAL